MPAKKSPPAVEVKKAAKTTTKPAKAEKPAKPAKPAKADKATKAGKASKKSKLEDDDLLLDIEDDLQGEPVADDAPVEKVKPLRMKLSKAKERALMKEFGLDDVVLSEEDLAKRRARLKALIKLGKTRG